MNVAETRKRQFFGRRFKEHLEKWQKENHSTQKDFCKAAKVSKNIVTAWKKGTIFPQDAQMQKICEVFGVSQRAFEPILSGDSHYVYNTNSIKLSEELERYAKEKGLREDFYQTVISLPDFLLRFPFDYPFVPGKYAINREFDLVKYQFEDEAGNRIMMSKRNIDFLVSLQNKSIEWFKYQMYEEKKKREREEIEWYIDIGLRHYKEISREEVQSRLYVVDLSRLGQKITNNDVYTIIREIARERGIKPRFSKKEIIEQYITDNPLTTEEWKNEWREWGKANGEEEKIEKMIREHEEDNRQMAQRLIDDYRKQGILDEDTED